MIPNEKELADWLCGVDKTAPLSRLLALLKEHQPDWVVGTRRMRAIRSKYSLALPTIVCCRMDRTGNVLGARDNILGQLQPRFSGVSSPRPSVQDIALVLGVDTDDVHRIARFYDRDPDCNGWYYEVYVLSGQRLGCKNSVLSLFVNARSCYTDAVIVKNGPDKGSWSPVIDVTSLAKTLWWCNVHGGVRETVAQRDFERMLVDVF
ncbi:hypothetical protein DFH06DRAFT_1138377 [Mycena polygramma]|nr:hypothetical protein DFH06DRAFT_1138377 [Mycena polygramma]